MPRIDSAGRRQRARVEGDTRPALEAQRFTLPPQEGDETRVLDRRPLQLVEHRLHFRHGVARGAAHLGDRCEGAGGIALEPRLRGGAGGLDGEQLLFDRIVEVAGQPCPLLLPRGLADLILGPRTAAWRRACCARRTPCDRAVTRGGSGGVKSAPGPGDRQVKKDETDDERAPRQHRAERRVPGVRA